MLLSPCSLLTGTIVNVVYGHKVVSDDDAHLKLVDRAVRLVGEIGSIGATIIDLLPIRAHARISFSPVDLYANAFRSAICSNMVPRDGLEASCIKDPRSC